MNQLDAPKQSDASLLAPSRLAPPANTTVPEVQPPIVHALSRLDSVALAELDRAQLHDRIESKVVMHADHVARVVQDLRDDYLVMDHETRRSQRYSNTYFDNDGLKSYHEHHNQKRQRFKIRYRTYVDSDLTYFEIKRNVSGRTVKERKRSLPTQGTIGTEDMPFLSERISDEPTDFSVSLIVDYDRILLVNKNFDERVTIDLNLRFSSRSGTGAMPDLAIVEFKQPRLDRNSPAMRAIPRPRQMFSKYCMGLATCDSTLKRNRFKKVFLGLDRLDASAQTTSSKAVS